MKFEYKIEKDDFVDFQLFTASKSERIHRRKRNTWFFLTLSAVIATVYFYANQNNVMTVYFGVVSVLFGIFYPKYFKWIYKRHYKKHINEYYANRFGQTITLEIADNHIHLKDKTGESKLNLSEIEKVDETNNHFFVKISSGISIIIPKSEIENIDELREKLKSIGLNINDETHWKWD